MVIIAGATHPLFLSIIIGLLIGSYLLCNKERNIRYASSLSVDCEVISGEDSHARHNDPIKLTSPLVAVECICGC